MDVLFLDANVLFSASYRRDSGLRQLWEVGDAQLVSSLYAVEEARRNLGPPAQRERLERLLRPVRLVGEAPDRPLPEGVRLPEKDRPILQAAIEAGATHLLTGDVTHFGPYYGRNVGGVRIQTPADYLRGRARRAR